MKAGLLSVVVSLAACGGIAAVWTSHGPAGGTISFLAVSPSDSRVIYAAAPDGIFRSRDAGAAWANVTGPILNPSGLVVSGTTAESVVVSGANGVFRSDDGGTTWQRSTGLPSSAGLGLLLMDPRDARVVYVVANQCGRAWGPGLYKSTDGARSFAPTFTGTGVIPTCTSALQFDPLDPDRLYTTYSYAEITVSARSDDGGLTWSTPSFTPSPRNHVVVVPGGQRYSTLFDLLITSSDGIAWSAVPIAGGNVAMPPPYNDVASDEQSGRIFLGTGSGVYRSRDGGVTWLPLEGAGRERVNTLRYDAVTGALTIATDFGLFRGTSFPWDEWTDLHVGNASMPMSGVAADPSDGSIDAISGRHMFRSSDFGGSWMLVGNPLPYALSAVTIDQAHDVYVSGWAANAFHIVKLTPSGEWRELRTQAGPGAVVADPRQPGTLYSAESDSIARTRDGGTTWERLPLPNGVYPQSLVIDRRDSNVMIVASLNGIYRSVDGGHTWTAVSTDAFWAVSWIVAAPSDSDVIYASVRPRVGTGFALARSTDGGLTWKLLPSYPAPDDTIAALAIHPHDPDIIFVSTFNSGVYRSADAGGSWQIISDGLPDPLVVSLAIDSATGFLHAATSTRGMWELPLGGRGRAIRTR